jgi:RNA polymerase sigma factor (sigma-70 family)
MRPVVYVVDDEPNVRQVVVRYLEQLGHDSQEFSSAESFLARPADDRPACLLLDVHLATGTGFDLLEELKRRDAAIPTIFMTGAGDIPMSVKAMKAGAVEFLEKPLRLAALQPAIEHALERSIETARFRELLGRLTPRERAVLPLVAQGMMNKEIASELDVVEQTVKVHRARVMEKLEAGSVADLVRFVDRAAALGIVITAAPGPTN